MAATNTIQGWRLPIRPLAVSNILCGGIHIHYMAPLLPPPSFFLCCTSVSFSHFLSLSRSGSPFLSVSLSPCLRGPPLCWLLLAAPVPPTLSLDMLFIGLQRGWLSVQGGCCLKQCSLNKRVFPFCFCVQTQSAPCTLLPPALFYPFRPLEIFTHSFKSCLYKC